MSQLILVVDDERNIALSLKFLIEQAGFSVQLAYDGESALEKIAQHAPDLVLLDVNMPKLDGYQVCEKIRDQPQWRHIGIIMLTAKGADSEREKGLAMGADNYITKPFSTDDVVAKVRASLNAASDDS